MTHCGETTPDSSRGLHAWLLPSECLECRREVRGAEPGLTCELCRARWRPLPHPSCAVCQHPSLAGVQCRLCAEWPAEFGPVRSGVLLDESVRRMMHAFKYGGWHRLARDFATAMVRPLQAVGSGALVPIPTDPRRRWRRGYDQAEVLAEALGRASGRPVIHGGLNRARRAASQVRLTPEERLANLAGVFRTEGLPPEVVLVDDVFTTGATLLSAARTLRDAGVARIAGVTFARAEPPLGAATRRGLDSSFFGSERL